MSTIELTPSLQPVDREAENALEIETLLEAAQGGDNFATYRLLEIVRPHLERLAHGYSRSDHGCETTSDLIQEAWLRAWQRLDQFEGGVNAQETLAKFRAWAGRIVHRLGLNQQRDQRAQRRRPADRKILPLADEGFRSSADGFAPGNCPPGDDPTASAILQADEEAQLVEAAIAAIPSDRDRNIIRLRFFEGMSLRRAALTLGLTYDAARESYDRALRRLEAALGTVPF